MKILNLIDWEIRLWYRLMQNRYYRRFHNYVYWLYHHDELVRKKLEYQKNGHEICIRYTFFQMILPGIMTAIVSIGCALFVLSPDGFNPFFQALGIFFPLKGQKYLCTVMGIWCASITAIKFYDLYTGFRQYGFLKIFHLKQPTGLNVNPEQLKCLRLYRDRLFSITRSTINMIYVFVFIAFGSMALFKSWKYSLFGAIFWYLSLLNAALHGCVVLYHTPMIIAVCQYYLELKQRALDSKLENFYKRLMLIRPKLNMKSFLIIRMNYELTQITKAYDDLIREIATTNNQVKWFNTMLFLCLITAQTYMTSVLLLVEIPIQFLFLFTANLIVNDVLLTIMLHRSSRIDRLNKKFIHLKQKCLYVSSCEKKIFTVRNTIKWTSMCSTMLYHPFGFTLANGQVFTSASFVSVIANISAFFFLSSQHIA
ncbi:uncharacterized protein LOC124492575 [Dermatophagoides farinae]|uniref:uncharacterized protein LOC124492575 n=1 Tax=Dermatophagoides farinae TaxID=6954 RepID=UPI001F106616|nr:uncharacterized protein LOC124492575 isoform X1 [Dermatophagoides farinae]